MPRVPFFCGAGGGRFGLSAPSPRKKETEMAKHTAAITLVCILSVKACETLYSGYEAQAGHRIFR